ncbi:hypothetical protein Tco_0827215 [Tanacetum coccineum]
METQKPLLKDESSMACASYQSQIKGFSHLHGCEKGFQLEDRKSTTKSFKLLRTSAIGISSTKIRWSTKPTSWLSRKLEQLSTSKLHAMGNVSSILTSQPIASNARDICLGVDLEPDEWIKDSGCSKHMTGNRKLFSTYKAYNGGNVIFGSNLRGNIIGKGQICDNKCRVTFSEHDSEITKDGKVIGRGIRKKGLYVMKLGNKPKD